MPENIQDIVAPSGLDTLSERALRRLTEDWTGALLDADTLLDARSAMQATSTQTFNDIVGAWRKSREVYHEASFGEVYGEGSYLADGVHSPIGTDSLQCTGEAVIPLKEVLLSNADSAWSVWQWMPILYELMVAIIILYYIFCLYRYFDDISALFRSVFQRQTVSDGRIVERRRSDIFYGALGKLFMLGLFFIGLLTSLYVRRIDSGLSVEQLFYLPFVAIALFIVVLFVQYLLLAVIGFVTRSMGEVAALMRIRLIYFVMATLLVAPIMLVAQVDGGVGYVAWQKVGLIAALMTFAMFVRESIWLFISKKVSILHWILYLCTVEILPFTLLWQGVVRLA